jgi:peptidoglycan/xylan/chitin deacetylase (PgdA/CDA1 family)
VTSVVAAAAVVLLIAPLGGRSASVPGSGVVSAADAAVHRLATLGVPIYCGGAHRRLLALTFDDGPGPATDATVRLLQRSHERATFFLVGSRLEWFANAPRRELTVGTIGDHTWNHAALTRLSPGRARTEIVRTRVALERATRSPVALFRPPYGFHDRALDERVRSLGMLTVLWSVDARDSEPGVPASPADIAARVLHRLRPGAIVLFHENRPGTLPALRRWIIPALKRRRLRSVTVPELLAADPPTPKQLRRTGGRCGES